MLCEYMGKFVTESSRTFFNVTFLSLFFFGTTRGKIPWHVNRIASYFFPVSFEDISGTRIHDFEHWRIDFLDFFNDGKKLEKCRQLTKSLSFDGKIGRKHNFYCHSELLKTQKEIPNCGNYILLQIIFVNILRNLNNLPTLTLDTRTS